MANSQEQLQREIKQDRPFRSPAEAALVGLLRTTGALRRRYTDVLAPYDLTPTQYNVLRILRGAGEPLPTMEIRDRMVEEQPGVTRVVDALAGRGLVERNRSAEDRRRVLCSITKSGQDLLRQLDDPVRQFDETCLEMLSRAEQKKLVELLGTIRSGLSEDTEVSASS